MFSDQWAHLAENKYNRLLVVLSLFFLSVGLPERYNLTKAIGYILCLGTMLLIVYQIKPHRQLMRLYLVLVIANVFLIVIQLSDLLSLQSYSLPIQIADKLGVLMILVIPILLIQKETFLARSVTRDTLKGGIAAYLLLGLLWGVAYDLIYSFDQAAFAGISLDRHQGDLLHLSFTTLTTLGYGDIHPISGIARVVADLEAVVGVLYPSILIARLVSLYETSQQL